MQLRIATYNILNGGYGRHEYLLDIFDSINADILCLQEVRDSTWLEQYAKRKAIHLLVTSSGNSRRRVALLSKFPITASRNHSRFPIMRSCFLADIQLPNDNTIEFIGLHLTPMPGLIFESWRWQEIKSIIKQLKKPLSKQIIVGDFNTFAPNDAIDTDLWPSWLKAFTQLQGGQAPRLAIKTLMKAGFIDVYRSQSKQSGYTLPSKAPNSRLDYIFCSQDLSSAIRNAEVFLSHQQVSQASDHLPVVATFEF